MAKYVNKANGVLKHKLTYTLDCNSLVCFVNKKINKKICR
jgi:hypothetical protein